MRRRTLTRRGVGVLEDPELDEIQAHSQALHTGSTMLISPEWAASAAERSRTTRQRTMRRPSTISGGSGRAGGGRGG
jgi:hypothetical protein